MIDWIWWIDAPFWQKLFAMTTFGGTLMFVLLMLELFKNWRKGWNSFIESAKKSYHEEIIKQRELLERKKR
jgi:hypothetical protein